MNTILVTLQNNRKIKIAVITLLVIGFILITLPLAIKWGAQYAIKEQGASEATIEDINLNLFTGRFELKQLSATFNQQPALKLNRLFAQISMSDLLQSKIVLEDIQIDGFNAIVLRNDDGTININGYVLPQTKEEESSEIPKENTKPLDFALANLNLTNSAIIYKENGFEQNLAINSIAINNIISWEKDSLAKASVDINEGKTAITADLDLVLFNDNRSIKGDLGIHGLNTQTYKKFHQQHVDNLTAQIDVDLKIDMALGDVIKGNVQHDVMLSNIQAQYQKLNYTLKSLKTKGDTTLNGSDVKVDTQLTLTDSKLTDTVGDVPVNSFKQLTLNSLYYDAQQVLFKQLALDELQLLENKDNLNLVKLEKITLDDFAFKLQESVINLKTVELQNPNINATLSKEKQLTHLALLTPILERLKTESTEAEIKEEPSEPKTPMMISINKVHLSKPGLINFNDLSVSPNYSTKLHLNTIDVNQITTDKNADFKLALKQGDYTTIDINGEGLLFNPVEHLVYTVDIKQLDLPPVSSYTSQSMGYGLKSGVVDTVIKGSIKQQQIDTKVDLIIDSIEVVETDKEKASEISGASGMSIDLALSTLKDKNNQIDLELPIGGDIKKPDFDLSLIINKAMGIAMKAASMSYLKHSLQPFSSLLTLYNLASDAASKISLAPIYFDANKTNLGGEQKELLGKVSNILNERPGIKIKTCGVASLSDQTVISQQLLDAKKQAYKDQQKGKKISKKALDEALAKLTVEDSEITQVMKNLADNRSAKIKAHLTGQLNIKPSRILNCLSTLNIEKESKPSVELII